MNYYDYSNYGAYGAGVYQAPVQPARAQNLYKPDKTDFVFAITVFVLGYLFSRWVLFTWVGWGVAAFTTAYLLTVSLYLIKKDAFVNTGATWFWLAATWATGISYAMWENMGFAPVRALFLFCAAVYFVLAASGRLFKGKTGNYMLIDGINAVILIPFRNFLNQYVSFSVLRKGEKRGKVLPVLLGVLLALLLLIGIVPLLERADSGGFSMILRFIQDLLKIDFFEVLIYGFFAIPVAAYLYGLVSGAAHRKGTDIIRQEPTQETVKSLRILHPATVFVMLGTVCGLYLVFILCQAPYFFSAFTGKRPEGWLVYSEYARRGFFELCGISVINLIVMTISNLTCVKPRAESRLLKAFNIALSLITLLLIATAFSKMAIYIDAYGLTMPRLLPCLFMVFLALVFIALTALQKWDFSIVRFALISGAVMLCALCLSNPDAAVVRYNTERFVSGTLAEYDVDILRRAGTAGVGPALEVYARLEEGDPLKHCIYEYLCEISYVVLSIGDNAQSVESYQAKTRLDAFSR